jgi:hypothetical protein
MCEAANFLKDVKDTSTSWDCSGSWWLKESALCYKCSSLQQRLRLL